MTSFCRKKESYGNGIGVKIFVLCWMIVSVIAFAACESHSQEKQARQDALLVDSVSLLFSPEDSAIKAAQLDTFFHNLNQKHGFNGTVLVAQYGKPIYKGAFGYKNFSSHDTLALNTPFQLASVSKQFTAVAIMQLQEKGLLSYEDSIQKFFPDFPYHEITVRSMLTHRSGLPNYMYAFEKIIRDKNKPLTNAEVIDLFIKHKPGIYYLPNKKFNYSNTGYFLLAAIVEKITGERFKEYVAKHIFGPAGMTHSFIFDGTDSAKVAKAAIGYVGGRYIRPVTDNYYLEGVTGDKGVYSTVEDMFKWDQALYTGKILKTCTLEEAFTPKHFDVKTYANYGFGWRTYYAPGGEPLVFHAGWWHGFKSYFMRNQRDHSTIVILSNRASNHSLSRVNVVQAILWPKRANFYLHRADTTQHTTE
ncbi:serine hydrolase domain-containing protein [Xanthocytophaga agilis]|uniref:Serine hydrolase domain-containing protein n=1 Tax=Xanthocytophaga agilis TaxID=3048010 RepID=A0AAE3R0C3_9BACT|nr:serine hydrolase domain-containing protein [Xanthocytophaga agilis]MDJ1498999.1 serine hydrolase domain-containing protein [Xanthocytophaga agilis]